MRSWSKAEIVALKESIMNWRLIILTLAFLTGPAFGVEKFLLNPAQDEDYLMKINDGGVIKDLLRADASDNKLVIDGNIETTGTITGAVLFNDVVSDDITIASGTTLLYPIMDLSAGRTITVNGTLYTDEVDGGTITGSGNVYSSRN